MNINATIIGQSIAFLVFVWFCMQYVWPPIIKALADRKKKIADGLEAAELANVKLEESQKEAQLALQKAKQEAQKSLDLADKHASQIVDQAKAIAVEEGEKIKKSAQLEIDRNVNEAKEKLKSDMVKLVVLNSERLLKSKINKDVNDKLVDDFITSL